MNVPGQLAATVSGLSRLHERVLVGIDGPDGAGKTTLADRLADALQEPALQVPTLRASVDGFNRPRAQRYERGELWTLSVYLRVSAEETLRRAHRRDLDLFGSAAEFQRRYLGRYLPGQALYRQRSDPEALAVILVDSEQADTPRVERWTLPGAP